MMNIESKSANTYGMLPLAAFLFTAPFAVGLYHEWMSCVASAYLLAYIAILSRNRKTVFVPKTFAFLALCILPVAYLITGLWAVDSGMAAFGFVKFLPLPLFALALAQHSAEERRSLLSVIPASGVVMTVLSLLLSLIPTFESFFAVNGRLAGFFQYPNTFALFLLLGLAVVINSKTVSVDKVAAMCALLFGIALSGSRMAFLLTAATLLFYGFAIKNHKTKAVLFVLIASLLAGTCIYVALTGDLSSVGRYLTTSLSSGTLIGRLLYYKDALPVIATHPFGLGYEGYHYLQGAFQTGVYSVAHIHNDLLQLLLDVGWLPTAAFGYALIRGFLKGDMLKRTLIALICLHSLLDFNLQFVSIGLVLVLATDIEDAKRVEVRPRLPLAAAGAALAVCCIYFGAASGLYYLRNYDAAAALYPAYTNAWVRLLPEAETVDDMDRIADRVLSLNDSVSLAHSAKARAAYAGGDFESMVRYKLRAIELARYSLDEYLDYFDMLLDYYAVFTKQGSLEGALVCRSRIFEIPDMLDAVAADTSAWAWEITDKPELVLPEFYRERLDVLSYRFT